MSNIYCGSKAVPKSKRSGTMKECAEKKQVRLWGVNKAEGFTVEAPKRKKATTATKKDVKKPVKKDVKKPVKKDVKKAVKKDVKKDVMDKVLFLDVGKMLTQKKEVTKPAGDVKKVVKAPVKKVVKAPVKKVVKAPVKKVVKAPVKKVVPGGIKVTAAIKKDSEKLIKLYEKRIKKEFADYVNHVKKVDISNLSDAHNGIIYQKWILSGAPPNEKPSIYKVDNTSRPEDKSQFEKEMWNIYQTLRPKVKVSLASYIVPPVKRVVKAPVKKVVKTSVKEDKPKKDYTAIYENIRKKYEAEEALLIAERNQKQAKARDLPQKRPPNEYMWRASESEKIKSKYDGIMNRLYIEKHIEEAPLHIEEREGLMAARRKNLARLRELEKNPTKNEKEIKQLKEQIKKELERSDRLKGLIDDYKKRSDPKNMHEDYKNYYRMKKYEKEGETKMKETKTKSDNVQPKNSHGDLPKSQEKEYALRDEKEDMKRVQESTTSPQEAIKKLAEVRKQFDHLNDSILSRSKSGFINRENFGLLIRLIRVRDGIIKWMKDNKVKYDTNSVVKHFDDAIRKYPKFDTGHYNNAVERAKYVLDEAKKAEKVEKRNKEDL